VCDGRGIVTAAGGRHIAGLWVLLSLIRDVHHCVEPVEVWYLGEEDFPEQIRRLFSWPDVTFIDASRHPQRQTMGMMSGWMLKSYAITNCRFSEAIWIDADVVPQRSPALLFDEPLYRETGALFWPDVRTSNPYNPIWRFLGLEPSAGPEWESGLMVIDRLRHWHPLLLAHHFNAQSDFYYQYVLGDKETFHLAWRVLDAEFTLIRFPVVVPTSRYESGDPVPYRIAAMWQHDPRGHRLFLHRTGSKFSPWGRNIVSDGDAMHDNCMAALERLRDIWDGRLTAGEIEVCSVNDPAGHFYAFTRLGLDSRTLELRPDGRVGRGTEDQEVFWRIENEAADPIMILSSRIQDTYRLARAPDGTWRGTALTNEQAPTELVPLGRCFDTTATSLQRSLLYITPVMPSETGNGLAMRAASALSVLTHHYDVSVLVVPLYPSGPGAKLPDWIDSRCLDLRWALPPDIPAEERDRPLVKAAWAESVSRAYWHDRFDIVHLFRTSVFTFASRYLDRAGFGPVELHIDLDDLELRSGAIAQDAGTGGDSDARQTAMLEAHLINTWDRAYVCSGVDKAFVEEHFPDRRAAIEILPNSITVPESVNPPRRGSPVTLLMVATFDYAPNTEAAVWFCRAILPVIREVTPEPVRVQFVGRGQAEAFLNLRFIPEVEFVGPVETLDRWYADADIVIAPLRRGGGTRIKILEALAHQRPVVSTSSGAEGLDLQNGTHLLIADRPHHFGKQCLRLIESAHLSDRLAMDGHQRVKELYSHEAVTADLVRRLEMRDR